jgi:hypothetical protein
MKKVEKERKQLKVNNQKEETKKTGRQRGKLKLDR